MASPLCPRQVRNQHKCASQQSALPTCDKDVGLLLGARAQELHRVGMVHLRGSRAQLRNAVVTMHSEAAMSCALVSPHSGMKWYSWC